MELKGLTNKEIQERISRGLQNKASSTKTRTVSGILIENIFSVFNLIISTIIIFLLIYYFISKDERLILDSVGVFLVALINTLVAVIQEIKAKRALDKVNLLLKKEAKVVRDGELKSIDQSEIVADDLVFIERGDQIAVDGVVEETNHLEIDESLLTGESEPILKKSGDEILSGSFCVSGNGYFTAKKVGDESYAAGITKLAKKYNLKQSPLIVRLNFIVKALFTSAIVLVLLDIIIRGARFNDVEFIRQISTIVISLVPQGLVLMASVSFALGVYRISKIGAIIQKLNAIESFSNVQVVCTDKTGTLTQNKLAVNQINILKDSLTKSNAEKMLGTYAKYSSDKNATLRTMEIYTGFDGVNVVDEIPFNSENKMSLLELSINGESNKYILGGFDISIEKTNDKNKAIKIFESKGLKVYRNILFGKEVSGNSLDELRNNFDKVIIEPICIVSISDIVRHDVMEAINLFNNNNVEVKILSGDSAPSVQAVAREIGWEIKDEELISGSEIDKISDGNFTEVIRKKKIFARLIPEHKLRIIKTLKKQNIYTAMIGDGVNDLPAIKESNMGIAMEEGSQITKEVADIVLLKNKFSLLPQIFDEGNKIVNTVSSVAKLFLTKNFMVIYITLLSILFLFDFPLTPRRVALINLFSIGLPAFIIALKNANVNKHKNFIKDLFSFVIISALIIISAGYAGYYYIKGHAVINEEDLQMIMMSIMIITTTANFLVVAIHKGERSVRLYSLYAILLIVLFVFLSITRIDFVLINFMKTFYEIRFIKPEYWVTVGFISLVSSSVLMGIQILRRRIIKY